MDDFEAFVRSVEPRLRRALIGLRGATDGRDATAEALAHAWQHWDRVRVMDNAAGYLYRVGQSRSRPRRTPRLPAPDAAWQPEVEPALAKSLARLSEPQRVAVFLVHGCGWHHGEVAEILGVSSSTVSTHVQRGLARLRQLMEVVPVG